LFYVWFTVTHSHDSCIFYYIFLYPCCKYYRYYEDIFLLYTCMYWYLLIQKLWFLNIGVFKILFSSSFAAFLVLYIYMINNYYVQFFISKEKKES